MPTAAEHVSTQTPSIDRMQQIEGALVRHRVVPSEGSHATFAPRGWKQRALQEYTEQELGQHCEVEHVACGSGLERIYRFLDSDVMDVSPRISHVRCTLTTHQTVQGTFRNETRTKDALEEQV